MDIDEPGSDCQSFCVYDFLRRSRGKVAHCGDPVVSDGNIAEECRIARPVYDAAIADQQIDLLGARGYARCD
jgi:hypothetical protein